MMRITGDEQEGKMEPDNFIDPESRYPVIATTSKLMTTMSTHRPASSGV